MANEFIPEQWELKGEGNANAVFAYCGDNTALVSDLKRHGETDACPTCS